MDIMTLRLRIRMAATVLATALPVVSLAGCGGGGDESAAKPAVNPGSPGGTPGKGTASPGTGAPSSGTADGPKDKYAYYGKGDGYTAEQRVGRDTWIMWTGGNEKFFRLGSVKAGNLGIPIEYFRLLDSRGRSTRFQRLGLVNEPNFREATRPDEFGLWLDEWLGDDTYPDTKVYGEPTGIMGLRKFPNPKFDRARWNAEDYYRNPAAIEPPYLIGMSCGFCHMGFNPLHPPADPEHPRWENLAANLGNQFLHEGGVFFGAGKIVFGGENGGRGLGDDDVLHHLGETQQRGTSETSRLSYDFINNPNAINSIFFLESRPSFKESLNPEARRQVAKIITDPDKMPIHHVLRDGSDSQGIPTASIRVYVNEGMCGSYWIEQLWNPFKPDVPQKPFDMNVAAQQFPEWDETLRRMPALESYLATYTAMHLENAEGGKYKGGLVIPDAYKTGTDEQKARWKVVERGQIVFAENCAYCHSSKQPSDGDDFKALNTLKTFLVSGNGQEDDTVRRARETVKAYFRAAVVKDDFLANNILTDDVRYPVSELKEHAGRALASNAIAGHVWEQFSSPEYKALPAARPLTLYNPVTGTSDRIWQPPAGGRGYYRTTPLVSMWATAPFLHNNSVGIFNGDPSVQGRIAAFNDAARKLLWPAERDGVKSMKRVSTRTYFNIRLEVLGDAVMQELRSFKPELPKLPGIPEIRLPNPFEIVENKTLRFPIPEGTPINLLANINISDPIKRVKAVIGYVKYVAQTDFAAEVRKVPGVGNELAKLPDRLARDAMDELLKISEYPDLIEDHGHEYGATLSNDDKTALIEYLKKL
jgi:hypothetical protein